MKKDKLQYYQRKLPGRTNQLREHLNFLAGEGIRLRGEDKAAVLDYLARLDEVQRLFQTFQSGKGPDLRPEKIRFESVQRQLLKDAPAVLSALGGPEGLQTARPATVTPVAHPWWFLDRHVAEQRALRIKRGLQLGGVLLVIGLIIVILLNTVFKPDPVLLAARAHYDEAFTMIAVEADYEAALLAINEALALRPEELDSLILKGVILELLGRSSEAAQAFEQASDLATAPEVVLFGRGQVMMRLENFDGALMLAEEAIDRNPNYAQAWYLAGQAQEQMGDLARALDSMNTAAELALEQGDDTLYAVIRVSIGYLASRGIPLEDEP